MLNQAALSIAAQPTDLLQKEKKSALDVEKLSVLMCEVSLPDNVTVKVREVGTAKRMTANRPQTSRDKRHLSKHTPPLDTSVPLELLQSAAALQPRSGSLLWRPSIHGTRAGWTHKQSHSNCFTTTLGRGCCSFSKGLKEPTDISQNDNPSKTWLATQNQPDTSCKQAGPLSKIPMSTALQKPGFSLWL